MSGAEPIQIEEEEQFLEDNNVHEEWRHFFREHPALLEGIITILETISPAGTVPELQDFFRAFSYLPPEQVKVVIVCHEPIGGTELATGLSFSFPQGEITDKRVGDTSRPTMWGPGQTVLTVHGALCGADILQRGGTYDCCHEEWAARGVLLLNVALTLTGCLTAFMREFVPLLLLQLASRSHESRLFVACCGSKAEDVGTVFRIMLVCAGIPRQVIRYEGSQETREGPDDAKCVIYIGHHPTFPRENNFYLEQATQQFREMNEVYPGLFALENLAVPAERAPDDN